MIYLHAIGIGVLIGCSLGYLWHQFCLTRRALRGDREALDKMPWSK